MNIDIICPLYNAENYIDKLHNSLLMQKKVEINSINYPLTKSKDRTEQILKNLKANYFLIEPNEFSPSLTREKAAKNCKADITVFLSQDVVITDEYWLYNLTIDIINGECEAAYSRQLCDNNSIEKYTREKNYPNHSFIKTKKDIEKLGLNAFFYSEAASAIKSKVFEEIGWYDGKNLPTNEDMYVAYKLLMKNYRIKYCANSVVHHSHEYTLKQIYQRYKVNGIAFNKLPELTQYSLNKSGGGLALYILKRSIQEMNLKVLISFIPNMVARYCGMKKGLKV